MAKRIEDYALIGDCESAALVGLDGSIDWLCWPRFDSGAVFASLLGNEDNGLWSISPKEPFRSKRRYLPKTLILETDFETDSGTVTLVDFMPLRPAKLGARDTGNLVRIVRGRRGTVSMTMEFILRYDYGSIVPWIKRTGPDTLQAVAGPDMVVLRTRAPIEAAGYRHYGIFDVSAGEEVTFSLAYGPSYLSPPEGCEPLKALESTQRSWEKWADGCCYAGPYYNDVIRSLITLKALTYRPTGGIVAAPTTSLPESLGGIRNWDYRFCWLRDATVTLMSLMNAGFYEEAGAWRSWLRRAVAGNPASVQIMYGLAGERRLDETTVPWLSGYEGAKPVRIGNAAAGQLQIDIYGEVMDALFQSSKAGLNGEHSDWDLECALVNHLESIWREPDEGIWEVRGGRQHFTYSKVMAWVAFDRAIRAIEQFGLPGPVERWRKARDEVHGEVCQKAYDAARGAFMQSYESRELDASTLHIALVGFLPPTDPRVKSTVDAIGQELMQDGLILRYRTSHTADGLSGREGAFLACSFWFVDNLVLLGRFEEAQAMFERLLRLANDVGLLAEEFDTVAGRFVGNFPQAYSHVSLINSAHNLFRFAKPVEERSGQKVLALSGT